MNNCNNNDYPKIMAQQAPTPQLLRIPTMDECSCFLEKNPTVMQIIGFLMDQQKNNQDDKTTPLDLETIVEDTFDSDDPDGRRYSRLIYEEDINESLMSCLSNDDFGFSFRKEIPIDAPSTVISLSELAFKTVSAQFKNEGESHNRKCRESRDDLYEAISSKHEAMVHERHKKFEESAEATMLKLIFPVLRYIKHGFSEKVKQEIDAKKLDHEQLMAEAKKEATSIGLTLRASSQETKNKQCSFVEEHATDIPSVAEGKLILCTSPTCYNLFYPDLVRTEHRCHIPDCMSESRNCGCGRKLLSCPHCDQKCCQDHKGPHVINCRPPQEPHRQATNKRRRPPLIGRF